MKDMEPFYFELGRRIQRYRGEKGCSQEDLGQRLMPKVTRASIANIEAGKQRVLAHRLVQIATALELDVSELLPLDGSKSLDRSRTQTADVQSELARKLKLPDKELKKLMKKMNI